MSGYDVTVTCAACGQVLVVPAHDLRAAFVCPRCGNAQVAGALVQPSTPLRAVPVAPPLQQSAGFPNARYQQPPQPTAPTPLGAGRRAWSLATWLATALGNVAWWLDRTTYGKRLFLLSVLAGAVWSAEHFALELYPWALLAYSSLLYLLLLAQLWWIRDDDGSWTWRKFTERSFGTLAASANGLFRREEFSFRVLLEDAQQVLIATGLGLVVLAPPIAALVRFLFSSSDAFGEGFISLLQTVQALGGWAFLFGSLAWVSRRFGRRAPATIAFKSAATALAKPGLAQHFPFVLDVRNPTVSYDALPLELRPLAVTLSEWRPREHDGERGYESSLVNFLKKRLPGVKTKQQQPFEAEDGTRGKLDVVIDDVLVIELKRSLKAAGEADRAVGQVFKYAASWKNGPVVLLLCEARWDFAEQPIVRRLAELHAMGRAVFVVAAGRAS